MCAIDLVSTQPQTCFNSYTINGTSVLDIAIFAPKDQIVTADMTDFIGGYPAGILTVNLYVATDQGQPVTWRTPVCSMKIFEVTLPTPQS